MMKGHSDHGHYLEENSILCR